MLDEKSLPVRIEVSQIRIDATGDIPGWFGETREKNIVFLL